MIVYLVVVLLSFVQSIFGVGLLVFGTPILLIMGLPFDSVLSYLLPCSIVISILQTIQGWSDIGTFRKDVPIYLLPFVVLGLLLVFNNLKGGYDIKFYVGSVLLLLGLIRISKPVQEKLGNFLSRNIKLSFAAIGTIHGVTNLGGGPLTVLLNGVFKEKGLIRTNIAYGYLLMAVAQIVTLSIIGRFIFGYKTVLLPAIAVLIYLSVGNRTFRATSDSLYYYLMTCFILLFGVIMVLTS